MGTAWRGDSIKMRSAIAWFYSNAVEVGDKMPMASGKLMRFEEGMKRQNEKMLPRRAKFATRCLLHAQILLERIGL